MIMKLWIENKIFIMNDTDIFSLGLKINGLIFIMVSCLLQNSTPWRRRPATNPAYHLPHGYFIAWFPINVCAPIKGINFPALLVSTRHLFTSEWAKRRNEIAQIEAPFALFHRCATLDGKPTYKVTMICLLHGLIHQISQTINNLGFLNILYH